MSYAYAYNVEQRKSVNILHKLELLDEAHTHTQAGKPRNKNKIAQKKGKRRKSKYGTEDLDLLWMEQGIALCLPVDF